MEAQLLRQVPPKWIINEVEFKEGVYTQHNFVEYLFTENAGVEILNLELKIISQALTIDRVELFRLITIANFDFDRSNPNELNMLGDLTFVFRTYTPY